MIIAARGNDQEDFAAKLKKALNPAPDFVEFPQATLDRLIESFWNNEMAVEYMKSRGFTEETLRKFEIGYSAKKQLVTVPMHTVNGMPIGLVGRTPSNQDKQFKNSLRLPTSKSLWNIHRARRHGETVIITEASFDGMRVDQAGYSNVVACLGGNISNYHLEQLDRNFNTVVLMTDFDEKTKYVYPDCAKCKKKELKFCVGHNPGRDLGHKIAMSLPRKRVLWASYEEGVVYPNGAKDAGDMSDDEIRKCLKNAVTNFTYTSWNIY